MIEDLGLCVDDGLDGFAIALEVWDEDFDATPGSLTPDFFDDHREDASAADKVVIAVDAGDDGVFEAEGRDGFGDAAGLVEIDGLGSAFGNGAEPAASGAEIAEQHECRGFMMPALADVRALGAFADSVKTERTGEALQGVIVFAYGGAGLEPVGLGSGDAARGLDLDEVHLCLL